MPADRPIRIVVAEDSVLTRLGIVTLLGLQERFQVVGEAEDGVRAVALVREHAPDVLLLDLKMPGLDGVAVTAEVARLHPGTRVLVVTHYDGDEDIFRAMQAGARGYLTKEGLRGEELLSAIEAVHEGKRHLPPDIADRLAGRMFGPALTRREQQVLEQLTKGLTNRDIASALAITERTVAMFVSSILDKLGARSRTEAVSLALQRGLVGKR